jgi:hypothetical protein
MSIAADHISDDGIQRDAMDDAGWALTPAWDRRRPRLNEDGNHLLRRFLGTRQALALRP